MAYRTKPIPCPKCKYLVDSHAGVGRATIPTKGSVSICMKCGCILVFDENLELAEMSEEELERIKQEDPEIYNLMQRVKKAINKVHVDLIIDKLVKDVEGDRDSN